jgi:hypothetical protein
MSCNTSSEKVLGIEIILAQDRRKHKVHEDRQQIPDKV